MKLVLKKTSIGVDLPKKIKFEQSNIFFAQQLHASDAQETARIQS